jgi:hypothetical protein
LGVKTGNPVYMGRAEGKMAAIGVYFGWYLLGKMGIVVPIQGEGTPKHKKTGSRSYSFQPAIIAGG